MNPTAGHHVIRTLIAEDQPAVLDSLCRFLRRQPFIAIVATAADGREAVALAATSRPDLVVADIHMPEMDGFKAAAEIKRLLPATRIILISVDQGVALLRKACEHGADACLAKIGLPRVLIKTIERLCPPPDPTTSSHCVANENKTQKPA